MTKEDIVNRVWENLELSKKDAAAVVDTLIEQMKATLKKGNTLKIAGFGLFEVRRRKARIGRNPKTGEPAEIKAGKTLKFKPGNTLRRKVAG